MSAVMGWQAQLGLGDSAPVDEAYEFLKETLALDEEFVDSDGLRATRSHAKEAVRQGVRRVGGSLVMRPTPVQLANLLPRVLGAEASGTTYALAESLPTFVATIDRVSKVFTYTGCKVDRAIFRSQAGEPLQLTLEVLGLDESVGNAGTFPSLSIDTTTSFFLFQDLTLSIGGNAYPAQSFELIVDNHLEANRFLNSATRSSLPERDRTITLNTHLPYGDATAGYATGVNGVAVVATFTNGNTSLSFSLSAVQFPRQSPTVPGRDEIRLPLSGVARKSGGTSELTVTLDSTP
jgi:hypothetical protein